MTRSAFHAVGLDVTRYVPRNFGHLRRRELLVGGGPGVVLDVGANAGQYGSELRETGFAGRIVSFEPVAAAFALLEAAAAGDPLWECLRLALGSADRAAIEINLTANDWKSSSLLPMDGRHLAAEPRARVVGTETVPLARLDTLAPGLLRPGERAFLKLDVQGLELEVLRGAEETLGAVDAVEAELSLVPLYTGQALQHEVAGHLYERGFDLVAFEPTMRDRASGDLLQANGIFVRRL